MKSPITGSQLTHLVRHHATHKDQAIVPIHKPHHLWRHRVSSRMSMHPLTPILPSTPFRMSLSCHLLAQSISNNTQQVAPALATAKIPILLTPRPAPDSFEKRSVLAGPPLTRSPHPSYTKQAFSSASRPPTTLPCTRSLSRPPGPPSTPAYPIVPPSPWSLPMSRRSWVSVPREILWSGRAIH